MNLQIRIQFEDIFPDEERKDVDDYFNGIPKNFLKQIPAHVIAVTKPIATWEDWRSLIFQNWLPHQNKDLQNYVYNKVIEAEISQKNKPNKASFCFLDEINSLIFLENVLKSYLNASELENKDLDITEIEINIFKAILVINSIETKRYESGTNSYAHADSYSVPMRIALTFGLAQAEINISNIAYLSFVFSIQIIKALYCFEFLSSKLPTLLEKFYAKYNCINYTDYLNKFMPLIAEILLTNPEEHTLKFIKVSEDDIESYKFINNFVISPNSYYENSNFKLLRSEPIIHYENDIYLIVNELFVIQKLYNGLYFELRDLYDSNKLGTTQFRSYFTFNFTEKYLFYKTIENIYGKRNYIQYNGEKISNYQEGGCDYYIRNGNKIFLFENKDILISAEVKESYNFDTIIDALDKKLSIKEGIPQIINNIKFTLDKKFTFDKLYEPKKCVIFPIIVTHNSDLDSPGINTYLNNKFKIALKSMHSDGYQIDSIKDLTLINIDILLIFQNAFARKALKLDDAIIAYHNFVDSKSSDHIYEGELGRKKERDLWSFRDFIIDHYAPKKKIFLHHESQWWFDKYLSPTISKKI